jgi:hypothetical protein
LGEAELCRARSTHQAARIYWEIGHRPLPTAAVRQRERLLEYAASHIQHMQKALTEMNLQLHHVVADISGATGCASSARSLLASGAETIARALTGSDRAEHLFALEQALALYDAYRARRHRPATCESKPDPNSSRRRPEKIPRSGWSMSQENDTRRIKAPTTAVGSG